MPRTTLALALTLALAACGDDHKGDSSDSTHASHEAGESAADTTATTAEPTTTAAPDTTTTFPTSAPAAPTDLMASILDGGVHLVWTDASDDEANYLVENKAAGDPDFKIVIELPFDSVTYHDTAVTAGTLYTYRVKAFNMIGEGVSEEVMIMVP